MDRKALTKHLRQRIAIEGIPARVRMTPGPWPSIQVFTADRDTPFTAAQQRMVKLIAKVSGLTWVYEIEINLDETTNPQLFEFWPSREQANA